MTTRRIVFLMAIFVLPGCTSWFAPDLEHACERKLRAANQELDAAREKGLAGRIEWIKAANLLLAAGHRQERHRYDSCLEKVRRARDFIQAAENSPSTDSGAKP